MIAQGKRCRLKQNVLGRWMIVHPQLDELGWSGSRWVEMDHLGIGKFVQVCNFHTEDAAFKYALDAGFARVAVDL